MASELKLTELLLALQGEQCYYTIPSYNGGFNSKNDINCFPIAIEVQLKQIVSFSSCVNVIEKWKSQHMYSNSDCLDAVKKTMLESIIADYNAYQMEADKIRRNYALGVRTHTINDLCVFVWQWKNRLEYLKGLLHTIDSLCGVELMNLLFREWTINCGVNDWRYRLLQKALHYGSAAMHQLLLDWIFESKLPALTRWFICPKKSGGPTNESRRRSSLNTSVLSSQPLNDSINNLTYTAADPSAPLNADNSQQQLIVDNCSGDCTTPSTAPLVLSVQLDEELLPTPFYGCPELLNVILDIGKKVHFLKAVRSTRSYEHQLDARQALCKQILPTVWYTPSDIGRLTTVIHQMHALVSADMGKELMDRQRLMDHLCLVHGYFFMLRGDFASALEQIYLKAAETSSKKRAAIPFSSRKTGSNSSKIAEKCVNDALALCKPPANVADLMQWVYGERLRREKTKGKIFSEIFMLSFGHAQIRHDQIKEFSAVKEFFSRDALRVYKRVFTFVSNLQLQRAQLDYTGQNLLRVFRRWRMGTWTGFGSFVLVHMQKARIFFTRLANYAFEEVLPLESNYIFNKVRAETDPHVLLASLLPLLTGIGVAFFFSQHFINFFELIKQSIRNASDFIGAVNRFFVLVEQSGPDDVLLSSSMPTLEDVDNSIEQRENQPPQQSFSPIIDQQQQQRVVTYANSCRDNGGHHNKRTKTESKQQHHVLNVLFAIDNFKASMDKLRTELDKLLTDYALKGAKFSPYWSKLYALLFDY